MRAEGSSYFRGVGAQGEIGISPFCCYAVIFSNVYFSYLEFYFGVDINQDFLLLFILHFS